MIKRIKNLISVKNLSASQFADLLGVQRSNISHILSERNKPSLDFILKIIAQFPEVSLDWLLKGKGEMFRFQDSKPESSELQLDLEAESISNNEEIEVNRAEDEIGGANLTDSAIEERLVENVISESKATPAQSSKTELDKNSKLIEQIMLLYTDGSFRIFKPQE